MTNIPFEALLNVSTLRPFYPQHYITSLTSTQWISLHLSLQYRRHLNQSSTTLEPKPIDKFWPFIKSLPREFGTVPLTWSVGARSSDEIKLNFDVDEHDVSLLERDLNGVSIDYQKQLSSLIQHLPLSVQLQAADVEKRFKSDWKIVETLWVRSQSSLTSDMNSTLIITTFRMGKEKKVKLLVHLWVSTIFYGHG